LKYIKQFGIIALVSFIGEILRQVIPLAIPASIYGIILLFLCLQFKIIPLKAVKDVSSFLVETMPVMFVPITVGIIGIWDMVRGQWFKYVIIVVVSTFLVIHTRAHNLLFLKKRPREPRPTDAAAACPPRISRHDPSPPCAGYILTGATGSRGSVAPVSQNLSC